MQWAKSTLTSNYFGSTIAVQRKKLYDEFAKILKFIKLEAHQAVARVAVEFDYVECGILAADVSELMAPPKNALQGYQDGRTILIRRVSAQPLVAQPLLEEYDKARRDLRALRRRRDPRESRSAGLPIGRVVPSPLKRVLTLEATFMRRSGKNQTSWNCARVSKLRRITVRSNMLAAID